MQPIERLNITLPSDTVRLIRAKVEEGGYASDSEVIGEAIQAWQLHQALHAETIAALRTEIAASIVDPSPSLTDEEVAAHFAQRARTASAHGDHA